MMSFEEEEEGVQQDQQWHPPPPRTKSANTVPVVEWSAFFDSHRDIELPGTNDKFRVYEIGQAKAGSPLFVLHHGGGHTALSWALAASQIKRQRGKVDIAVLAFDCRGHGHTKCEDDFDLSLERLSNDMIQLIQVLYSSSMPDIFLVGHSMGGAVVVHAAGKKTLRVQGLVVVDVVEGTALESVSGTGMMNYLHGRPSSFSSIQDAVSWSISSETIRNADSAAVSIPPQIVLRDPSNPALGYTWRTDLFKTKKYWQEWYTNLSDKFLSARGAKLLILAGPDRLDKPLMIGQMQGKFQLKLLPACGHNVQEDQPDSVAAILIDFMQRNATLDIAAIRKKTMIVY